jgi:hypothetical protein
MVKNGIYEYMIMDGGFYSGEFRYVYSVSGRNLDKETFNNHFMDYGDWLVIERDIKLELLYE